MFRILQSTRLRRSLLASLATLSCIATTAYAQPDSARAIQGKVADIDTGIPLVSVTLQFLAADSTGTLQPTSQGAFTREDGSFSLATTQPGALAIRASYVGYQTDTFRLSPTQTTLIIGMQQISGGEIKELVTGIRRTRSVEDACCRVESIRDEVQQHAPFSPTVNDVLRRYSSCTSSRINCAIDNSSSVRLRGLEPTRVQLLMDGMPSFSGLGTLYGLAMLPTQALQTIRITEGASSSFYGNGAVAGVVDLETRPPTELPELTLMANLAGEGDGLPNERDLSFGYTGLAGDIGIAAFGSFNSHGEHGVHDDHAGEFGAVDRSYTRYSGLLKGNTLLGDATELTLTAFAARDERGGDVAQEPTAYSEEITLQRTDVLATLGHTITDDSELLVRGMVSFNNATGLYGVTQLDAAQRITYGNARYTTFVGNHGLAVGLEARNDMLTDDKLSAIEYDITTLSAYAHDEFMINDQWMLLASLRADNHSSAGTIISPRGSVRYNVDENITMRVMAGQGFKGEALFDEDHRVLHGIYTWRNNPELDFEKSWTWNYDINYSGIIGEQFGFDANFNVYYTTISNKHIPNADSLFNGTLFYVNSPRPARLTGIEVQFRPTYGEHLSGSIALGLINYALEDANGGFSRIPLAPSANIDVSAMYHDRESGFSTEVWGNFIGTQTLPVNNLGLQESEPYTVLNIRTEKKLGPIALFAGILNLLDARQTETMPLAEQIGASWDGSIAWGPLEGREFFAGIRWTYSEIE